MSARVRMCWPTLTGLIFAALMFLGCASITSAPEELQKLNKDEGVVFGSFMLSIRPSEGLASGWAFLLGRKAEDLNFTVEVQNRSPIPLRPTYMLPATPGKEAFFVKKLPAGNYQMRQIAATGFLQQGGVWLGLRFAVKPCEVR